MENQKKKLIHFLDTKAMEEKTNYGVSVYDITFYLVDEDGNEKLDKYGKVQQYACNGRLKPLEYLCEDMTEDDLIKLNN